MPSGFNPQKPTCRQYIVGKVDCFYESLSIRYCTCVDGMKNTEFVKYEVRSILVSEPIQGQDDDEGHNAIQGHCSGKAKHNVVGNTQDDHRLYM